MKWTTEEDTNFDDVTTKVVDGDAVLDGKMEEVAVLLVPERYVRPLLQEIVDGAPPTLAGRQHQGGPIVDILGVYVSALQLNVTV